VYLPVHVVDSPAERVVTAQVIPDGILLSVIPRSLTPIWPVLVTS
jgi:hypothetical protein